MKAFVVVAIGLVLPGCASMSSQGEYAKSAAYQEREALKENLVLGEGKNLSAEEIRALLTSKVDLKRPLKIAVVRADNLVRRESSWATIGRAPVASEEASAAVKNLIANSKYIKDVSFIPRFLMPTDVSLRNLRDVAAVMQADLLLMLFPRASSDAKFKLIGPNQAKATVTIESMLVDVRTGAIPFTSVATGTAQQEKDQKADFSDAEFQARTETAAEDKAFEALTSDLVNYVQ